MTDKNNSSALKQRWEALKRSAQVHGPSMEWDKFIASHAWVWPMWNDAFYRTQPPASPAPASAPTAQIHQVASQLHPNGWHDCSAEDAEGHRRAGFKTRVVYTAPASAQEGQGLTDTARLLEDLAKFDGSGGMQAVNELVGRAKFILSQPATTMGSVAESNQTPMCESCDDPAMPLPGGGFGPCQACIDFAKPEGQTTAPQPPADSARLGESVSEDEPPLPNPAAFAVETNGAGVRAFTKFTPFEHEADHHAKHDYATRNGWVRTKVALFTADQLREDRRTYLAHMMSKLGGESVDTPEFRELLKGYANDSNLDVGEGDVIRYIDAFVLAKLAQARAAGDEAKNAAVAMWNQTGEELEKACNTLRALSSYVGQGGCWDTENLDYAEMEARIKEGIDSLCREAGGSVEGIDLDKERAAFEAHFPVPQYACFGNVKAGHYGWSTHQDRAVAEDYDEKWQVWLAASRRASGADGRWGTDEIAAACVKAGLGILECNSLIVTLKGSRAAAPSTTTEAATPSATAEDAGKAGAA